MKMTTKIMTSSKRNDEPTNEATIMNMITKMKILFYFYKNQII